MKKTIIAIDPGKSGGIALFANGRITAVKMPANVVELQSYLKMILTTYQDEPIVFIEKVSAYAGKDVEKLKEEFVKMYDQYKNPIMFFEKYESFRDGGDDAPGKKFGINKMLANYTELLTVIKLLNIDFIEVSPISWQSTLGLRIRKEQITKTERKNRYKKYAENCFPELGKITLSTSDALCLVQFAFTKYENDQKWINEKIQNKRLDSLFN